MIKYPFQISIAHQTSTKLVNAHIPLPKILKH